MAYGIKLTNIDDRVVLDSSENRLVFIKSQGVLTASIPQTGGYLPPPIKYSALGTGLVFSDIIFARVSTNGRIAAGGNETALANMGVYADGTGTFSWFEAEAVNAAGIANHDAGYGINVYDGVGTASANLLFSTNVGNSIEVVAIGSYTPPANVTYTDIAITDGTVPHYVMLRGSHRAYYNWSFDYGAGMININHEHFQGYEYFYTGSTLTKIRVHSVIINYLNSNLTRISWINKPWMIVKLRS